jgi:CheY-like chemotaxis protein
MGNTILLADKSVTIQKIVQLTFADEDFKITCFSDGQLALDAIPQVRPDVILADIGLPVRNGYDLCVALRKDPALSAYANTPVILLAGIYETMDEERARQVEERVKEVGANALLSKPFDPQLLTTKVKELIEQAASAPAAPQPDMFAEVSAPVEEGFFDTPVAPESIAAPPDNEKTMMLPGPPGFGASMFADAPPFEEEMTPVPKIPVDVDAVKPEGEMVFEENEMASMPEELPAPELSGMEYSEVRDESPGFPGFEEQMIEPPAEEAFAAVPAPSAEEAKVAAVSDFEDPFGDVFAEPAAPVAWSATASEEESPFGVPEPPPPPPAPPEPEVPSAVEEAFNEPEILEEPSLSMDESDREQMEEMMGGSASIATPDVGEDTWSRARAAAEQEHPVEELFETTQTEEGPPAFEETVELQADVTSPGIKLPGFIATPEPEPEMVAEPETAGAVMMEPEPAVSASVPGLAMEITDEAIERIARRVVELLSDRVVAEIVWQVVPDLAEKMIRRELEKLHASND